MKRQKTLKLVRIDMLKANECKHPDISPKKTYLVNYDGAWMIGKFEKEWYGWYFDWFGTAYAGLQLDALDEIWEVKGL